MIWLDSITDSINMNLSKLWDVVKNREAWHTQFMGSQRVGHDAATAQQQQQTKTQANLKLVVFENQT